jgi:cytochrome P450
MMTMEPAPAEQVNVPARKIVMRLARDPMAGFDAIGRECDGRLARLRLGPVRPYLVTHPNHVEHVYRNADRYRREGMLWRPVRRLVGDGIAGEGRRWRTSRRVLQPLMTMRHTRSVAATVAAAVSEAVDRLEERARGGEALDVLTEMTRITHRVLIRVFFGDRIAVEDADRLGAAIDAAFESLSVRLVLPWVGNSVPMPGDRTFARAVKVAGEIIDPLIRGGQDSDDLVSHFVQARDEQGHRLDAERIRHDLIGMVVAGTETTALTLTWLWLLLDAHPDVMGRVTGEVLAVVGGDTARPEHIPDLVQTRLALQETLRLYPVGWILPRTLYEDDVMDGIALRAGSTVLLSPYLTHRLPEFWSDPLGFDPRRFVDREVQRFSYIPFGGGPHTCLGEHFALIQAQLAVAEVLRRFRPAVVQPRSLRARPTASLRPRDRVRMTLQARR